jgi:hypothetical protein
MRQQADCRLLSFSGLPPNSVDAGLALKIVWMTQGLMTVSFNRTLFQVAAHKVLHEYSISLGRPAGKSQFFVPSSNAKSWRSADIILMAMPLAGIWPAFCYFRWGAIVTLNHSWICCKFFVIYQRDIKNSGNCLPGRSSTVGAEPAGGNDDIRPHERFLKRGSNGWTLSPTVVRR